MFWSSELGFAFQKDDHIYVRQSSFLKFYGPDVSHSNPKSIVLAYIIQQLRHLGLEHSEDQVWSVCCCLTWEQSSLNLWPIGSHYQEEISTSKVAIDGKSVLKILNYSMGAASEGRWKDCALAHISTFYVGICCHCICKTMI
jgi:hypothetical protein